ncbi:MAG: RNA polymerase sigma factor [Blastocatellia bacterium]|nr:RNA polymerase sigma factor [Blastocatellia bacterium]
MALLEAPESAPAQPLTATVIARAKAGDRDAFEQLFIRYQRQVLRTAARMLGNFADAQDAAQEVFLRLHKYLHRFQEEREFSPWLYQVTANVCHEIAAKRKTAQTVSFEQERETGRLENLPGGHDVEASYHAEQERKIIAEAIASLPEKERMALILRDLQGLETSEVARILGSSETTVRSQISMARVKIKRFRDRLKL